MRRSARLVILILAAHVLFATPAEPAPTTPPPPPPQQQQQAARTRLVMLDLAARDVDAGIVKTIADDIAVTLQKAHIVDDVVSASDLRALVDVDANKRAAGHCDDDGCMAELAEALGADVVVHGSVGRLGDLYAVTISFFDAKGTRALARERTEARRLEALSLRVEHASKRLALQYQGKDPALAGAEPPDPPAHDGHPVLLWTGAGLGAAGVVVAAIFGVLGGQAAATIGDPTSSGANKATAQALEPTYFVIAGGGGVVALAGVSLAVASLVMESPE